MDDLRCGRWLLGMCICWIRCDGLVCSLTILQLLPSIQCQVCNSRVCSVDMLGQSLMLLHAGCCDAVTCLSKYCIVMYCVV